LTRKTEPSRAHNQLLIFTRFSNVGANSFGCQLSSPTKVFDRGLISFDNNGKLFISSVTHEDSMKKIGIITDRVVNVGGFPEPQREFPEFHRTNVFLK
jgi:hypothetical protein